MDKALTLILILCLQSVGAQIHWVNTFETFPLNPSDSIWFGEEGQGGLDMNGVHFKNNKHLNHDTWNGFAVANGVDESGLGKNAPHAVNAAHGANQSKSFLVLKDSGIIVFDTAQNIYGFYTNNSAHTVFRMKAEDKPDRLNMVVYGWSEGQKRTLSDLWMGSYTNSSSYAISKEWRYIDLSKSGKLDSMKIVLVSRNSEVTESYVCLDNFNQKVFKSFWRSDDYISALNLDEPYLNGENFNSGFGYDGFIFSNQYNDDTKDWTGFSVSKAGGSADPSVPKKFKAASQWALGEYVVGHNKATILFPLYQQGMFRNIEFLVNNSMRTLDSMRYEGTSSKKFGGQSGDDPDYLALKFQVTYIDNSVSDTFTHFLADFRFSDNSKDYMIEDWAYVHFPVKKVVSRIDFWMEGSDTSNGILNTPSYFCLTHMILLYTGVESFKQQQVVNVHPNPTSDRIYVKSEEKLLSYLIYDAQGRLCQSGSFADNEINVSQLPNGVYTLVTNSRNNSYNVKWIKQ